MTIHNSINSQQLLKSTDTPIFNGLMLTADIDFSVGNKTIGASIGANTLTLGGLTTTISIAGSVLDLHLDGSDFAQIGASTDNGTLQIGGPLTAIAMGGFSIFQNMLSTTDTTFNINKSLEFLPATSDYSIASGMGAHTLTLGGSTSTISIAGNLSFSPQIISGDLFPTTTSLSIANNTNTSVLQNGTLVIEKSNGITIAQPPSATAYCFKFSNTGVYAVAICCSFRPAIATGNWEFYLQQNSAGSLTGDRFCYMDGSWQSSGTFPTSIRCVGTLYVNDTTKYYQLNVFQVTGTAQTLGMTATNRQKSSFCIYKISEI